jgi:hypothetical protein
MVVKYGDPRRAEFNYSSNVKPRSESKIFTDFSGGMVSKVGASTPATPNDGDSAAKRANFLPLAILRAAAYTPPIRINRSALLIAPNGSTPQDIAEIGLKLARMFVRAQRAQAHLGEVK